MRLQGTEGEERPGRRLAVTLGAACKKAQSLPEIRAGDFRGSTEALGEQQGLSVRSVNFHVSVTMCALLGSPRLHSCVRRHSCVQARSKLVE